MQRGMRLLGRNLFAAFAAAVIVFSLVSPARADVQVSGTYRITTGTGKHMIVTLIQNGDNANSIDGMYVGNGGVAGRLHGTWNNAGTIMSYTWEERNGDYFNSSTRRGWGNMTWSSDGRHMQARWGYENQGTSVGSWDASLIDT
jgi:hypothetical protein